MKTFDRRRFLTLAGAAAAAAGQSSVPNHSPGASHIPIGLELYSVRRALSADLMGTVRGVGKMGYECVEFFSPYYAWTPDYAKEVRKLLDELQVRCYSTHNDGRSFSKDGLTQAIELNQILGTKYIVMADPGKVQGLDGWKAVAETLNRANEKLKPLGMHTGYHNHIAEFAPLEGKLPMQVLADNTSEDIMLQLDVGHCLGSRADPLAWIKAHPGRIRSLHLKDWSPDPALGYKVLLGEGVAPWKQILAAAEEIGGVEYYLIEQEGSRFSEMETAERCLASFRKIAS